MAKLQNKLFAKLKVVEEKGEIIIYLFIFENLQIIFIS